MIIFEGPDGAGKTTLINQLRESWEEIAELPIAPRVVSKDAEAMTDLVSWVETNVRGGFQPVIYDRHRLVSELIYGPIFRGSLEEGFDEPLWLRAQLVAFYSLRPIIVYCLPHDIDTVRRNLEGDPDNSIYKHRPEAVSMVWGSYMSRMALDMARTVGNVIHYDYQIDHPSRVAHPILRRLQQYKEINR